MGRSKNRRRYRAGFVSTRLAGTDGVSLETEKWVSVLERMGMECFFFSGESDWPRERSYIFEKAHFLHPDIRKIFRRSFGVTKRSRRLTNEIHDVKEALKTAIYDFIGKYSLNILIPENVLTIPLNIPLGIAITEVISETGIPTIAHHHDFYWERQHLLLNCVRDYLNMAFPPDLPSIRHVVINSAADNQLSYRTGISATIIPNVMDFSKLPAPPDDYARDLRQELGVKEEELFVLQPTRVVKRKGIEHSIELLHRLGRPAKLVISHASGDEGHDYERRIREYAKIMGVKVLLVNGRIQEKRGMTPEGRKIYSLADAYKRADLVTYPSTVEGFGNAFLEAIYFKKPIMINTYSIYETDIKPKGFKLLEMNGYISAKTIKGVLRLLDDAEEKKKMVEHNYKLAKKYYSFEVLERKLGNLLHDCLPECFK